MEAKFVKQVMVSDPDTGGDVELSIYKHQNGGMFALDSSYIEQVLDDETVEVMSIYDPFADMGEPTELYLID